MLKKTIIVWMQIDRATYNSKTRAILVVNLFGQVYDYQKINAIAKKHNLYVIEDSAQAPFAKTLMA